MSRQAIVLYARVLVTGMLEGRTGFIGRREAERLADECGSLVDELVEAGLWRESGLSYLI